MLRISGLISAFLVATVCAPGSAQTVARDSESVSCPRGGLSVYYARGEASPSEQAMLLIDRIGDDASRCRPDGIDIVTEIDTDRDGEDAIRLAMSRLNNVADSLVEDGYPIQRIRLAAQSSTEGDIRTPMGGITVYFRQSGAEPGNASSATPAKASAPTVGAI